MKRTVGVIGGGPSGLAVAKAALEHGLRPTVFERAADIGGVWRPRDGAAWPGMSTNLSHYLCAFSDFPWPRGSADFPRQPEVAAYLRRYAEHFALQPWLRLGHEVIRVARWGHGWELTWRDQDAAPHMARFDAVVVASGIFSRPRVPRLPGSFAGPMLHSSQYCAATDVVGGRVAVVGMSFSGADIAAELADAATAVTAVAGRPMWLLPRHVAGVPRDLISYTRHARQLRSGLAPAEANRQANRRCHELGVNPGEFDPRLRIDPDSPHPAYVLASDRLPALLAAGALVIEPGRVARLERHGLVLDTGARVACDAIVWCTGYHLELPFLSDHARAPLRFDPTDLLQPLLLHQCTFHPDLAGMAFVGLYRGPFFAVLELQARWACAVLSGRRAAPRLQRMRAGLAHELEVRLARPRPQFPHPDYVGLADGIAAELGVLPDLDPAGEHFAALWDGPVIAAHYRLRGPGSNPTAALGQLASAMRRITPRPDSATGAS
ncbi:MAG: flavin-containing monooxygenase [Egibacteraceae bacterium]